MNKGHTIFKTTDLVQIYSNLRQISGCQYSNLNHKRSTVLKQTFFFLMATHEIKDKERLTNKVEKRGIIRNRRDRERTKKKGGPWPFFRSIKFSRHYEAWTWILNANMMTWKILKQQDIIQLGYVNKYTHKHIYVHMCLYTYVNEWYICIYSFIHMYVFIFYMHTCLHTNAYICIQKSINKSIVVYQNSLVRATYTVAFNFLHTIH